MRLSPSLFDQPRRLGGRLACISQSITRTRLVLVKLEPSPKVAAGNLNVTEEMMELVQMKVCEYLLPLMWSVHSGIIFDTHGVFRALAIWWKHCFFFLIENNLHNKIMSQYICRSRPISEFLCYQTDIRSPWFGRVELPAGILLVMCNASDLA